MPTTILKRQPSRWPLWALAALVCAAPLARPSLFRVYGRSVQLSDIMVVVFYASTFADLLVRRISLKIDLLFKVTLLYWLALGVSLLAAGDFGAAASVKLTAYGAFLFLPWTAMHVLIDEDGLKVCLKAWLVGLGATLAIGVLGIIAFYADRNGLGQALMCGYGSLRSGNVPRLCAPFLNQNMFMNYLIAAIPLGLLSLDLRGPIAGPLVIVSAIVGVLTFSGGVGGMAITMAILFIAWTKRRTAPQSHWLTLSVGSVTVLVAVFFAISMVVTRVPSGQGDVAIGNMELKVMDGPRPSIWRGVLPNIARSPLVGIGYGATVSEVTDPRAWVPADKLATLAGPWPRHLLEAHNVWLSVLGQAGILGLVTFLALLRELTRGWWWGRQRWRLSIPLLREALGAIFAGAFLYHGLFGALEESRHLWPFFALAVSAAELAGARFSAVDDAASSSSTLDEIGGATSA